MRLEVIDLADQPVVVWHALVNIADDSRLIDKVCYSAASVYLADCAIINK